tara:strand:- start:454 stop:1305 length:852 start_codon:yes stop_codon:yes gene_type:complete
MNNPHTLPKDLSTQAEQPTIVLPESIPAEHTFILKGKFDGYEGDWHLALTDDAAYLYANPSKCYMVPRNEAWDRLHIFMGNITIQVAGQSEAFQIVRKVNSEFFKKWKGSPSLRHLGRWICYCLTLLYLGSLFQLEPERFSSRDFSDCLSNTWGATVVAAIAIPIVWAIAGFVVRKKNVKVLSRKQTVIFLLKSIASMVLIFATIPSMIEGCSSTYPIAHETLFYLLLLAIWTFVLTLTNFSSYRREPSRKSMFFLCITVIMLSMSLWVLWKIIDAIAASALT